MPVMKAAAEFLQVMKFATAAHDRGIKVIIAGAGGAAHLPGVIAAYTPVPVIGVPIKSSNSIDGWDSILSILQMPSGIPVATVALDGAKNAAILAAQILAAGDPAVMEKVVAFKNDLASKIEKANRELGKTTGYRAALLGAAFLLSTAGGEGLGAQELPQEIVRLIETQAENGGGDPDGMVEYFTELLDRPIDLSMADMATLEACPLFTPFMTVSLLEYRREYGPVSSAAELALVDGFSPAVVELLQPFVTFGCVGSGGGQSRELKWYEKFSGKWTVRSKMDLERGGGFPDEGFPVPFYSRLRVDFEDRCSAGLTLENDRGERSFPDFCSFFISVQNLPLTKDGRFRLEAAVAGDFSLRFGQGLVLWNSFSMSGLSSPSAAVRRDGAVRPYTSSDENNYFHGAAMTFGFPGGVRASVFYSNNGADAAVEGEYFTSLPDDGLHDTDARRQGRNALREEVAGGNVSWRNSWFKAGVTAAAYRYDRLDGRRTSYYNEHLRYDGWWGNAGADFLLSLKGVRVFGEAAADFGGAFAVIGGAVWPLSASVEASLVYRYYSPLYIATHAGSYSRSNVNNEHGVSVALRWSCGSGVAVSASAEYTHFPWARFGVREPSDCLKAYVDCQWVQERY